MPKKKLKQCVVKSHFECDGTGLSCDRCGESSAACLCEDDDFDEDTDLVDCTGCLGSGRFCVEHEAACPNLETIPRCVKFQEEEAKAPQRKSR